MKRRGGEEATSFASSPPIVKRQIPNLKHALSYKTRVAILALDERLYTADREQWDPEDMEVCARRTRLELRILSAARALLHSAGPLVVAHHLACAKKDNHLFDSKSSHWGGLEGPLPFQTFPAGGARLEPPLTGMLQKIRGPNSMS
jgi:hypothetical protein